MRNIILLITIAMLSIASTAHAQPDSLWSRIFGAGGSDMCTSLIQMADGGFAMAGYTYSFGAGDCDFWLVRTDAEGDSLWSHTFGGRRSDYCRSLIQTSDGGFALAGSTNSFGAGYRDFWLVKTNTDGDSIWSRTYGGGGDDLCFSLIQTEDGGFALAGSNYLLVRTNAEGNLLWQSTYSEGGSNTCRSVIETADGGFALAGDTYTRPPGNVFDFRLVRTNNRGDLLWSSTIGGWNVDNCHSLIQTADGGFTLAGYTDSFLEDRNDPADFWLVRTNARGDSLWSRTFSGMSNSNPGQGCSLIQVVNGGFAVAGSNFWLFRTNAEGDSLWSRTYADRRHGGICESMIQTVDGGFALAGGTPFRLVKTGPDPVSAPSESFISHPSSFILYPAYPNPFNSTTTIEYALSFPAEVSLNIYNLSGRRVETLFNGRQQAGVHSVTFNAGNLPSGLYFVRLEDSGQAFTKKVMLIR